LSDAATGLGRALSDRDRLDRAIGPWALGANAVNLTVGAGIFALPAAVAAILGPAAILAYLLCAALIVCVLACFAEVGSRTTRSGGAVAYIEDAFGPLAGFLAWVVLIILYEPAADAAIAVVVIDSLIGLVPGLGGPTVRVVLMALMFGGLVAVNVRGVRQGLGLSVATTVAKLVPLVLLAVVGAFSIRGANLAWHGMPAVGRFGTAALTLFFAFGGIETALTPSGEVRDPARTVPRGVFGAVVAVVVLYLALQVVSQGVLGDALATQTGAPLAATAGIVLGGVGRSMVLAGATIAGFGAIAADYVCSPRAFIPVAERGLLPSALASIHPRFHTPWVAIIVFGVIGFALAVSGGFAALAVLAGMALLLIYLGVCLAALRMRYTRPAVRGTFRAPGGPAAAVLGSVTVVWLLAHSGVREAVETGGVIAAAMIYYALNARLGRLHPAPFGVDSEMA
jgi:amino acid transporter